MTDLNQYLNKKVTVEFKNFDSHQALAQSITCVLNSAFEQGIVLTASEGTESFIERFYPWNVITHIDLKPLQGSDRNRAPMSRAV